VAKPSSLPYPHHRPDSNRGQLKRSAWSSPHCESVYIDSDLPPSEAEEQHALRQETQPPQRLTSSRRHSDSLLRYPLRTCGKYITLTLRCYNTFIITIYYPTASYRLTIPIMANHSSSPMKTSLPQNLLSFPLSSHSKTPLSTYPVGCSSKIISNQLLEMVSE